MSRFLALLFVAGWASCQVATCDSAKSVCATFVTQSDHPNMIGVRIESSSQGWAALGFGGKSMAEASYFAVVASNQVWIRGPSGGYNEPAKQSKIAATPIPSDSVSKVFGSETVLQSPNVVSAFWIPNSLLATSGNTNFIYASCSIKPGSDGSIQEHDGPKGSFTIPVSQTSQITVTVPSGTKGSDGNSSTTNGPTIVGTSEDSTGPSNGDVIHGGLMFAAWGVLPYFIIFVARYLKFKLGHTWFIIHAVGGGIGIVGLNIAGVAVMATIGQAGFEVYNGKLHVLLGAIVIYGVLPLQIILGVVADRTFDINRTTVPWWDQLHWWLGRISLVVTAATLHLGMNLAELSTGWFIALWVWIGLMVAMLVGGQVFFKTSHHVAEADLANHTDLELEGRKSE